MAYDSFLDRGDPYVIDTTKYPASITDSTRAGAAYVTGYDFVKDEADAIGELYQQFGFQPEGDAGPDLHAE